MEDIYHLLVHIMSYVLVVIFIAVIVMAYSMVKRLYGGKFTSALPYMFMGIVSFGVMPIVYLVMEALGGEAVAHSMDIMWIMNALQIMGGIFFMLALYRIYQSQYLTQGLLGGGKNG